MDVSPSFHRFDCISMAQPGLALSPRELLARVGKGLVNPSDLSDVMQNDDNDIDTYPHEEATDLAVQYQVVSAQKEMLKARIAELQEEKKKKALAEKDRITALNEDEKLARQAEALRKYFDKTQVKKSETIVKDNE